MRAASELKRIAVIGGGPSGLVTVKELNEKGHKVTAFEQRSGIGGVFSDTYQELQLTSSSLLTSFGSLVGGDPKRPVLWRSSEYLAYLHEYAARFGLLPHFQFGTAVHTVRRGPHGGWLVRARAVGASGDADVGRESELYFDNVVICSGSNLRPRFPAWADASRFNGRFLHSGCVKNERDFADRNVLVVGLGESGADLALIAARVAKQCAISSRNGPGYVIPRTYRGLPADLDTNRCYHSLPRPVGNKPIVRFKVRIEDAMLHADEDRVVLSKAGEINRARGVSPFHRFGTKSTGFIEAMIYHGASYRQEVAELHRDHVVFVDGSTFHCDLIVFCTGFAPDFPFLEEHEPELASRARNARALYKHMIVPEAGADIAWVGYVRPAVGSVLPCAEMQARYLAQLISAERALPAQREMVRDAELHAQLDFDQFGADASRLAVLTDYFRFMETMADVIGCRPPIRRLALSELGTALKVLFGPLSAAQYRLAGPGADRESASAALRLMPTMPWPVLAYELFLLAGCWIAGLLREPWRRTKVDAAVVLQTGLSAGADHAKSPLLSRFPYETSGPGGGQQPADSAVRSTVHH